MRYPLGMLESNLLVHCAPCLCQCFCPALLCGLPGCNREGGLDEPKVISDAQAKTSSTSGQAIPGRTNMPRSSDWKKVDKLISEQKYENHHGHHGDSPRCQAKPKRRGVDRSADQGSPAPGWAARLRKRRCAFCEPRRAKDPLSQAALELYYAHSLMTYLSAYSWELADGKKSKAKKRST